MSMVPYLGQVVGDSYVCVIDWDAECFYLRNGTSMCWNLARAAAEAAIMADALDRAEAREAERVKERSAKRDKASADWAALSQLAGGQ